MGPVVRTLIFTVIVPSFWAILVPYWVLPRGVRPRLDAPGMIGFVLITCGVALYLTCAFWGFASRGRGTPAPFDPPKKLVTEGPYRVVRNPMYWSVALVLGGEAIVFRSAALVEILALFAVGVVAFVLLYEEPTLRRKFGAEYEEYCRRVPRWIPHLTKRPGSAL